MAPNCGDRIAKPVPLQSVIDEAAQLEGEIEAALPDSTGRNRNLLYTLRAELSGLIDEIFDINSANETHEHKLQELRVKFSKIIHPLEWLPVDQNNISFLMEHPEALQAGTVYKTGSATAGIREVSFAREAVADFLYIAAQMKPRYLRAINAGLVASVGAAGVKRLQRDHDPRLVEVKTYGAESRLVGCLDGGHFRILRYSAKHLSMTRASVDRIINLCD